MPDSLPPPHVTLVWTFTPPGYLNGHLPPPHKGYALTFSEGKIEARIELNQLAAEPDIERRIDGELRSALRALQVMRHQHLDIVGPARTEVLPDGRRVIEVDARDYIIVSDDVEFVYTNEAGEVVYDSFQARLDVERAWMARIARHSTDSLLGKLQHSYVASLREPNNELVHLYEIPDALATRFGGKHKAQRILAVSDSEWGRLGRLANDEPLRQGRHRGKTLGELRDATAEELSDCRRIAKVLIDAYLDLLDRSNPSQRP